MRSAIACNPKLTTECVSLCSLISLSLALHSRTCACVHEPVCLFVCLPVSDQWGTVPDRFVFSSYLHGLHINRLFSLLHFCVAFLPCVFFYRLLSCCGVSYFSFLFFLGGGCLLLCSPCLSQFVIFYFFALCHCSSPHKQALSCGLALEQ